MPTPKPELALDSPGLLNALLTAWEESVKPDRDDLLGLLTQAICCGADSPSACCGDCGPLKDQVREILKVLRDHPTEAMIKAGEAQIFEHMPESADWSLQSTKDGWVAMIDWAIRECAS